MRLKIELWGHMYPIQLSSEGEVNKGGNKGIYLALFTDSEGIVVLVFTKPVE